MCYTSGSEEYSTVTGKAWSHIGLQESHLDSFSSTLNTLIVLESVIPEHGSELCCSGLWRCSASPENCSAPVPVSLTHSDLIKHMNVLTLLRHTQLKDKVAKF